MSQPLSASRRANRTPTRLEDQVYSLVQFVDDGILAICTPKNIRTRDDGRKEAQYGDDYYLCTVMYEGDDKEDVMKRKNALEKLTAQGKSPQTAQKKKGPRKSAEETEKEKGEIKNVQVQNGKEKEKAEETAEKEKKKAETEKKKAENEKKKKKKAETEKKKAENAKKKAENEKKKLEKDKQKAEKEKEKAERERERAALKERDNRVLMQMNLLANSGISSQDDVVLDSENEDPNNHLADNFDDEDLVSRCTDILQVSSRSYVGGKRPTNWSGPQNTPTCTFGGLNQDEDEPMTQPTFTGYTHKIQPPRPSFGGKRPRVNNLYTNRSDTQGHEPMTQPTLTDDTHKIQPPRPSFGGKRPRINNLDTNRSDTQGHEAVRQPMFTGHTHNKPHPLPSFGDKRPRVNNSQSETPACVKCEEHLATIRQQREEIAQLRAQVNGCYENLPRPGKVPQLVADRFKMVELSKGRGVFLYEDHISTAKSKNSPTSAACFLLSCFYKNSELVGKNLTGANARESINADIVSSILDFAVKEGGKLAAIKQALRNKISSITTRANGWRPLKGLQDSLSSGIDESD